MPSTVDVIRGVDELLDDAPELGSSTVDVNIVVDVGSYGVDVGDDNACMNGVEAVDAVVGCVVDADVCDGDCGEETVDESGTTTLHVFADTNATTNSTICYGIYLAPNRRSYYTGLE